uniref:Uncharacterized protein n=1 Tax=Anguilla anguilla TaxID=7936 RepID=A0A0E9U6Y0_ANGAN
MKKNVLYFLS